MLKLSQSLLLVSLGCVSFGGACSNDDDAPPAKIDYRVAITHLDATALPQKFNRETGAPEEPEEPEDDSKVEIDLRCDGTLAVTAAPWPAPQFELRPANACGESTRCGYIRMEGLDQAGAVLASVDTATTQGVLRFTLEQLPALAQVRVALIRGLDRKPLLGQDDEEVERVRRPTFIVPSDCAPLEPGSGGAGAGGMPSEAGGAGGQPSLGGAGGETAVPANGGAGAAGAGAGGVPSEAGASSGGVAGAP